MGDANVKLPKTITMLLLLSVAGMGASDLAFAQRHGGFHGHGGFGGPRIGLGFSFGFPIYAPYYYAPAPYYYPPYAYSPAPYYYYPPMVEQAPQTYIEQGTDQPAPAQASPNQAQGAWWYYCAESRSYYPYVRDCPGGWQRVSPTPPG